MLFSIVSSSVLILVFDLESSAVASGDQTHSQLVAGYFVLILINLFLAVASVTIA